MKSRHYIIRPKKNDDAKYRQSQKECEKRIKKAEWGYIRSAIIEGLEKRNSKNLFGNNK